MTPAVAVVLLHGTARGIGYESFVLQMTTRAWQQLRVDPAGASYGRTVSTLWLLVLVYALYLGTSAHEALTVRPTASRRRVPVYLLVPTSIAAALTLVFGLASSASGFPLALARRAADVLFGGG